jgi:protein-disulfide isomerase
MRVIFIAAAFLGFAQMVSAQQMTDNQIKQLALEAILENPEIIMQAVAILEKREREQAASGANTVRLQVEQDPNSPNLGNPAGDVTVVEFFDYNCPYCRQAGKTVQALLAADANVRVIYAARAALAARAQGKYEEFHWVLMNGEGRASEASILKTARDLGLDITKLKADMISPAVEAHIAQSSALARKLGFTGTPAFIVGDRTAPGMLSVDEITALVAEARASK